VCANTPLDVCPTTACISWRAQIADLIGQGNNENQIQQYFIDHFGMRTVAIPTDPMSRVLVLGLPYVLIGLALLVILAQLWRWRHTRRIIAPAGGSVADGAIDPIDPAVLDEYQTRFEAEIKDDRR